MTVNNFDEVGAQSIVDFYFLYIDKLYENPVFKRQILNYQFEINRDISNEKDLFKNILSIYLEEAKLTLSLLNNHDFTKQMSFLEIGGGSGLVYGFLKKQGYNIYGIEPCDSGFDGYYSAAIELFKVIDVDASNFRPFLAKDVEKLDASFDVIFSNNVFEHIPELEESIVCLKKILKVNGIMIHNTVNYFIPYEPHFQMLLLPFFPRYTELFKPSLKKLELWNGLNFITTHKLAKMCRTNGLKIDFMKDRLFKTFIRLDNDQAFAKRQKLFVSIYRFLKSTGLIKILNKIPIAFTTPITFTITHLAKT